MKQLNYHAWRRAKRTLKDAYKLALQAGDNEAADSIIIAIEHIDASLAEERPTRKVTP